MLTTLVVVVKLKFEHYNLLFPILLICALAIILKKYKVSKDYRIAFFVLLAINFICFVMPDKTVYRLRNNHRYFWSERPLGLSHFKIRRNTENDTTGIVNPTIIGSISKVYNFPPAIIFASDNNERSWIDTTSFDDSPESKKSLNILLEHEKRHLDIMEIYVSRAQDSVNKMIFYSYGQKYEVVKHYFELSEKVQKAFDAETDHGTIDREIEKWNKKITLLLNKK